MPAVVFTEPTGGSTVRSGRLCSQLVAENSPLRFSTSSADPAAPGLSARGTALSDSRSPRAQKPAMVSESAAAGVRSPVAAAVERGCTPPGERGDQERPRIRTASLGLAAERERLERLGLPHDVVRSIQGARAASTTASYASKWAAFQRWCAEKGVEPFFMSIRLRAVIPPAADEQKFSFQHH
ncbi:hypothetical protein ILYODFUR_036855 [Ilyodon furcidens]|uniref:Uncharacterized protein n=1 Tax=Ilyodon furcidens TaxID=33524 RepID=A0ABV0T4Y0_9TELE